MEAVQRYAQDGDIAVMTGRDFTKSIASGCFPHQHIWLFSSDDGWEDSATGLAPVAEKYHIPFNF